jgi:splicing factor 3B subunit 1
VIKQCGEDQLLSKLGLVLFEQLGEEYPDTLGSIIAAEGAIANVVGMTEMNPPVKDLCESLLCLRDRLFANIHASVPRMTPILRNRHEKVQEASINLIGRIGEFVLPSSLCLGVLIPSVQPIVVRSSFPLASGCEFALSCWTF